MPQLEGQSLPAVRRRGRPVGSDSAETRNPVLKSARKVINERGSHAATFQSIAMAANLSRPRRKNTLLEQLTALVAAMHEADFRDRSQVAFLVSACLESTRNPELQVEAGDALRNFLESSLGEAKSRGELSADTAVTPIADMLHAMSWGVGCHAGFIDTRADMGLITATKSVALARLAGFERRRPPRACRPRSSPPRPPIAGYLPVTKVAYWT